MSKVVTFGEIMMRLQPPGYQRFAQAKTLEVEFGGGEANVAVSLAQFGLNACFVTKLPKNPMGDMVHNELRKYGVCTRHIARGGERLGIYFIEKGASVRASKVVYDRKYSAIATAERADFNWDAIFDGADWFHFTGITPALSDGCAALALEACKAAKAKGVRVSCDLNYRKNLWSSEKAGQVMATLMPYVDLCIANEEDAEKVFGIQAGTTDVTSGHLSDEGYKYVAQQIVERFGCKQVAITLRESHSASDNGWSALLYDGTAIYKSRRYELRIVDRVGGGDSFGAGLIYATLQNMAPQDRINFAVAASALAHTIEGDMNLVSLDEVKALAGGDASGRVQR